MPATAIVMPAKYVKVSPTNTREGYLTTYHMTDMTGPLPRNVPKWRKRCPGGQQTRCRLAQRHSHGR